jgi:hypothetical protein
MRWRHPKRGMISPAEFIPLAEETDAIIPMGEWALRTACRDAAAGRIPGTVAVNLSPVQFSRDDLAETIHAILIETGLPPRRLEVEVTESTVMSDQTRGLHILRKLKAMGILVAMDDFGTGTILLEDANLDEAIPAALVIAFLNSGQACAAGTRLLVPSKRLEAVKRAIVDAMTAFAVGDPADPKIAVGPMVSQKQFERVQCYIRKGIDEGSEVLVGGEGHPQGLEGGYFVKPTVFVNVTNDMAIAREEIFGPVLSVIAYDTEDEAISIANDSKYGLHAAVLGTDLQRARRVACRLRAGRVVINGMTDDPQAPWGGFKYSGVGREYGRYGIEAFLETRAILET